MRNPVSTPFIANATSRGKTLFAALIDAIYPPLCISCSVETDTSSGLCGSCWADTFFICGSICDCCGTPLINAGDNGLFRCDNCIAYPPAWDRGRAAVVYDGAARRITLSLKHGDRHDIARPMAQWMSDVSGDLLEHADIIAPVPLHWKRMLKRKFNQSALLGHHLSLGAGKIFIPDLLQRVRPTKQQMGMDRLARQENQKDAIQLNPKHHDVIAGKSILIVDDVLTTGATLSACATALRPHHPVEVNAIVFARVARFD